MTSPRLATYSIGGSARYGAVTDAGIVDLSARSGHAAETASELIRWQMLAKERGHHLKFRISESTMEGLVRLSIGNLLELVD